MEVKTTATLNAMQEKRTEAADFLIDTRRLPPALRQRIFGMIEAVEIFNVPGPDTGAQKAPQDPQSRAAG